MICSCGKETETRRGILDIGFIHGCWDDSHTEVVEITDCTGMPLEQIYDKFPICGIECETEEQAIKSYLAWKPVLEPR